MKKIIAGLMIIAWAGNVGAKVLFTDDFSRVNSGKGWADRWSEGSIAGGEIEVKKSTSFRTLAVNIDPLNMDFWYVSRLTITGFASKWAGISFFDSGSEDLFLGSDRASNTWMFKAAGTSREGSDVPSFTGGERLLVAHITATSLEMWIDPSDVSSIEALGPVDRSVTARAITSSTGWNQIRIGTIAQITVNDMTAATTFSEAIRKPGTSGSLD